jgi:hypothetical protein
MQARSSLDRVNRNDADPTADGPDQEQEHEDSPAEEAFVRGLIDRGEAAKAVDGKLPPGATHEIVEERPGRLPKVVRRRFSAF